MFFIGGVVMSGCNREAEVVDGFGVGALDGYLKNVVLIGIYRGAASDRARRNKLL